jgi:suppressor of ftsI
VVGAVVTGILALAALNACGSADTNATATASTAGALVPTTFPAQQGRPFAEPKELRSSGGVLRATFTADDQAFDVAGASVRGKAYEGTFIGPTLHVRPGDTIAINLKNRLGETTNLHTHGFFTSPAGISDNVLRVMKPGSDNPVRIKIPPDMSPGTYWYHSHLHGKTEEQVFSGLAGVIIVDGLVGRLPPALRDIPDRVLALKDLQVKKGAIPVDNIDSSAPTTRTVNGLVNPRIDARPGGAQLLRLANLSADIWYRLKLDGSRFNVIAEDANPVGRVWRADELILPPGKRFDVLVRWDAPGTYRLRTLKFSTGPDGDSYPERTLATVDVAGEPIAPAPLPTRMGPLPHFQTAKISRRRTLTFGENNAKGTFFINGRQFQMGYVNQYVKFDTNEEWTLRNVTRELHPFHIHVNDFQVMSIGGRKVNSPSLMDTVALPMGKSVVIRMRFRRYTGKFVYHCHILAHEDAGMMGIVDVTKTGRRPADSGSGSGGMHRHM